MNTCVLYAAIKDQNIDAPLYPAERESEVRGCRNKKTMVEKYLAWKLLEIAVRGYLNLVFDNLQFTKNANGQWVCPGFYFSLSHTESLVCVAVSDRPVGIDAELVRPVRRELSERVLTERELAEYVRAGDDSSNLYLLECWVKKESIFKMRGGVSLNPRELDSEECETALHRHCSDGREYLISLCADGPLTDVIFDYLEEI